MIGSLIGFTFKGLSHKWNDTVLGYCAGVMLAAAVLGLLLPAADMAGDGWGIAWVVIGGMAGALFPDFVIASPKNLHQRVLRFSGALPLASFACKRLCSVVV